MADSVIYESVGTLRYSGDWRLAVEVEQDIADYYRSLIPKWLPTNRPRWPAHITVVREEKERPTKTEAWGKYDGHPIKFWYSPFIHSGKVYYWLNAFSSQLEDIRVELGLPVRSQYTLPPEGFAKCFHITIANQKGF